MIKKNLWIVALIAIFAITFMGCPDNWGDPKNAAEGGAAEGDLVIDDVEEIAKLLSATGWNGDSGNGVSVEKNVAKFNIPSGGSTDNQGFELLFPEEAEGFSALVVTFKLKEVTTLANGAAKIGFKSAKGSGDVTPYADHEVVFGTAANKGKEFDQSFSLKSPNKLPNNVVYFSHNKYGPDNNDRNNPNTGSEAPVNYELEITQLLFVAKAAPPCCEKKCIKSKCKDCSEDKCIGECGVGCCLNFTGNATTKVEFVAGVGLDGKADKSLDKVIHTMPQVAFDKAEGEGEVGSDGTVTMNNYSILFYKFPTTGKGKNDKGVEIDVEIDYMDYDYIDITYTLSGARNVNSAAVAANGTDLKIEWRDYKGIDAYATSRWDNLGGEGVGKSKTIQTWGDNGTGGFAIRMNSYDTKPNAGDGTNAEFMDIKITKIEFRKGTRYKVEFFSPMTPNNNSLKSLEVLSGNGLMKRLPTVSNPGWTFTGWVNDWNPSTNQPAGTPVGASTAITANTKLFATWVYNILPAVTLNAAANDTLFAAGIGNAGNTVAQGWIGVGATTTFTHSDGKKYWIVSDARGYTDTTITTALDSSKYDWTAKDAAISQADFDAAKNHHLNNYTRLGLDLTTVPNWNYYKTITIYYDAIPLGGTDAKGTLVKKSSNAAGGDANAKTTGGNEYPELTGKEQKIEFNVSEFTSGGATGTVPGVGFQKNNNGAYLLRITKVELSL